MFAWCFHVCLQHGKAIPEALSIYMCWPRGRVDAAFVLHNRVQFFRPPPLRAPRKGQAAKSRACNKQQLTLEDALSHFRAVSWQQAALVCDSLLSVPHQRRMFT